MPAAGRPAQLLEVAARRRCRVVERWSPVDPEQSERGDRLPARRCRRRRCPSSRADAGRRRPPAGVHGRSSPSGRSRTRSRGRAVPPGGSRRCRSRPGRSCILLRVDLGLAVPVRRCASACPAPAARRPGRPRSSRGRAAATCRGRRPSAPGRSGRCGGCRWTTRSRRGPRRPRGRSRGREAVVGDRPGRRRVGLVPVLGRVALKASRAETPNGGAPTHCRENIWHMLCQRADPLRCCCWANSFAWP